MITTISGVHSVPRAMPPFPVWELTADAIIAAMDASPQAYGGTTAEETHLPLKREIRDVLNRYIRTRLIPLLQPYLSQTVEIQGLLGIHQAVAADLLAQEYPYKVASQVAQKFGDSPQVGALRRYIETMLKANLARALTMFINFRKYMNAEGVSEEILLEVAMAAAPEVVDEILHREMSFADVLLRDPYVPLYPVIMSIEHFTEFCSYDV